MHLSAVISLVLSLTLLSTTLVQAQPFIQYPPVARVNAPYTHSFPQSTLFPPATSEHEASTFNFTASQIPNWLSLQVSTTDVMDPVLTFSGLPVSTDAESSWVRIIRTSDSSSYNYTRGFRMSVSDRQPATLDNSLYNQLIGTNKDKLAVMSSVTPFSVSDFTAGVQIPSTWSFSIGLRSDLFHSSSPELFYSATLDEGQPLPEWLGFDNRTITFYGNAPSLNTSSIPQTFNITVGCTDYPNTPPSMVDVFVIVITPGKGKTMVLKGINATVATQISYDLRSAISDAMSGDASETLSLANASVIVADTKNPSSWLSLDSSSWFLTGIVPATYAVINKTSTLNVPISLHNATTSTPFLIANATIPIHIYPYSFSFPGTFNVSLADSLQLGDSFSVDLSRWILGNGTIHFDIEDVACAVKDTLYYDGPSHSLKGSIPPTLSSADARSCLMEFSVQDVDTAVTSTSMLNVVLPSALFGSGSSTTPSGSGSHGLSKGGIIALSVFGGLFGLLGLLALLFCLRHRIKAMFKREPRNENEARKHDRDDMDFVDIIRDSYSRQYERYRSYRQSRDTAATVVGSLGGKPDKDKEPVENKPIPPSPRPNGGSSPGRLEAKVLPVLGRVPSLPKSKEPDFDMVDVNSPLPSPPKTSGHPKVTINAVIIPTPQLNMDLRQLPLPGSTISGKALSPSPKKHQTERANAPPSPIRGPRPPPKSTKQTAAFMGSQAPAIQLNQDKEKPKRIDLMRVLRAGINESPLPSSPSLSSSKRRLEISNPQPHPNPAYRPEISSVAANVTSSPDLFSSSSEIGSSFFSEPQVSPATAAEMRRTFSSSRFSADTLSAETSESWQSEEAWRQQKKQGVEGADSAAARTTKRRRDRSRSRHRRHQSTARISQQELSPTKSSGITMAEKLRQKMARVSERIEGFALGSPDSVVPRRRADFGPPRPRPQGAVYSEGEEEGEYIVREEDMFGVVRPLSTKAVRNARHRSTKSASTLLPSLMAMPKFSSPPSETKSSPSDEVGRSFPDSRLDFEEYGHWLHATMMEGRSDGEGESTDDEIDTASSYHRATLVPVGGNVALRQQLVSSPGADPTLGASGDVSPGPVMVTTATVIPGRRSCETNESVGDTPSLEYHISPTKPLNFSSTTVDTRSSIKSPASSAERLRGLGLSCTDLGSTVRDDSSPILPFSPSKQTVRLVKNMDRGVTLSPDSVSSGLHRKPTIVVQDTSDAPSDIPMHVVPSGKSFAFHPILSLGSSSGRSTPMSTASGSSTRRHGYVAMLENGDRLPSWLRFDADALEFWGRSDEGYSGHLVIVVVKCPSIAESNGSYTPSTIMDEGELVGRLIVAVSC
ncbi:hypothetical protein FRC04_000847 [Tulasnella sp. 424]|nr:hypothetical protein FRC04_000847 [Tulasnella sp. 424]